MDHLLGRRIQRALGPVAPRRAWLTAVIGSCHPQPEPLTPLEVSASIVTSDCPSMPPCVPLNRARVFSMSRLPLRATLQDSFDSRINQNDTGTRWVGFDKSADGRVHRFACRQQESHQDQGIWWAAFKFLCERGSANPHHLSRLSAGRRYHALDKFAEALVSSGSHSVFFAPKTSEHVSALFPAAQASADSSFASHACTEPESRRHCIRVTQICQGGQR